MEKGKQRTPDEGNRKSMLWYSRRLAHCQFNSSQPIAVPIPLALLGARKIVQDKTLLK